MKKWLLDLKNKELDKLYSSYLYSMDQLMIFYLSCVTFDNFPWLDGDENIKIRASNDFHESATSIRFIGDVKKLIYDKKFQQLYRRNAIITAVSILEFYLEKLIILLKIKNNETKKIAKIDYYGKIYSSKAKILRYIFAISRQLQIDNVITHYQAFLAFRKYIATRNLIIHNKAIIDKYYIEKYVNNSKKMKEGDFLNISEGAFDDIFHFFNSHIKAFTRDIDNLLSKNANIGKR